MLEYQSMSRRQRRDAQKLAKELLQTTPPASEPLEPMSLVAELATAFMKPENVVAAIVYGDGNGNYFGDVVLKKGTRLLQKGALDGSPLASPEEAFASIRQLLGQIKAMREHPIVAVFREKWGDPDLVELLRVEHEEFGYRYVYLQQNQIPEAAKAFASFFELNKDRIVEANNGCTVDALQLARDEIIDLSPDFASRSYLLGPSDLSPETERKIGLLHYAAAYLFANGVIKVDDKGRTGSSTAIKSDDLQAMVHPEVPVQIVVH